MENLFGAVSSISTNLNHISKEGLPRKIKNLKDRADSGDNANFAVSLFQEYLINPNTQIKNFLSNLSETVFDWANNNLYDGYEKMTTAHHGPELFLGFLPKYIQAFPEEIRSKRLIVEAAQYIGNWKKKEFEWYDYKNETFKSWYLGSAGLDTRKVFAYETADHTRFIHIALVAWRIEGDNKYFDWALKYGKKIAKKITESEDIIPVAWGLDGKSYYPEDMKEKTEKFLAANHHHIMGDPLSGIENLIASGTLYAFGDLYKLCQENIFKEAAKKIITQLLSCVMNPYADPAPAAISYYRDTFLDYSFDNKIIEISKNIPPFNTSELTLVFPEKKKIRHPGIGNRKDMIYWQFLNEDGTFELSNEPSTSFFTLVYQITGNINYADRALTMAARKLKIAKSILRSGYEHADMGCAVCSVSSGHGRNWGIGSITGCYAPLILGSLENFGSLKSIINWKSANIPNGCISIVRRLDSNSSELNIINVSNVNVLAEITIIKSKKNIILEVGPKSLLTKKIINS